jgi:16S rRNA (uracil1498-N3)-methyltransferase
MVGAALYSYYICHPSRRASNVRTIRIYQPGPYEKGHSIELSATASQHVGVVLRMQPGEPLILFCGDNREFSATITTLHKKKVVVTINAVHDVNRESPRAIHLAQALSKGERMEFVIQKAVELGVASITPLFTSHCVVRLDAERLSKKQAQWQAIAIAACEQSGRNQLPVIHKACSLEIYLQQCQAPTKLVLHPATIKSWREHAFNTGDIALLIGPEGGLSDEEVSLAKGSQFQPLCLGPRILRTETAAIAALSVIQAISGDL